MKFKTLIKHVLFCTIGISSLNLHAQEAQNGDNLLNDINTELMKRDIKPNSINRLLCFDNSLFKEDSSLALLSLMDKVKTKSPGSYSESQTDVCVNVSTLNDESLQTEVETAFSKNHEVTAIVNKKSSNISDVFQPVLILKAVATGVVMHALDNISRPVIDHLANKKGNQFASYKSAALVAAAVDVLQRLGGGELSESDRLKNDALAVFINDMFHYGNQNTTELGLILALTNLPYTNNKLKELSTKFDKDVDWKVPVVLLSVLAFAARNEKLKSFGYEAKNKGIEALTYGTYHTYLAMKYDNSNFATYLTMVPLAADELIADTRKNTSGVLSAWDAFFGVAGIYASHYAQPVLKKILPKGWYVQPEKKGARIGVEVPL